MIRALRQAWRDAYTRCIAYVPTLPSAAPADIPTTMTTTHTQPKAPASAIRLVARYGYAPARRLSLSELRTLTALGWTRGQYAGSIVYRMPMKGGSR